MPIESDLLQHKPEPFDVCPHCEIKPFRSFLRGQVQRMKHPWYWPFGPTRPYCAVICTNCHQVVGYEAP